MAQTLTVAQLRQALSDLDGAPDDTPVVVVIVSDDNEHTGNVRSVLVEYFGDPTGDPDLLVTIQCTDDYDPRQF